MVKSLRFTGFAIVCLFAASLSVSQAEDLTPPIVRKAVPDITVAAGAPTTVINVRKTFALQGVTSGSVVRFTTTLGNIDVELYPASTPKTVANFLSYVDRGEASKGGYGYSFIHELVRHSVLEGGGYYVGSAGPNIIDPRSPIPSEAGLPNTTGTIAMALTDGPNSATSGWFFNLADNTNFNGASDGGPFTVFGRVIEDGMDTIRAVGALKLYDLSTLGSAFASVPLLNSYNINEGATPKDLVYVKTIARIPLTAAATGQVSLLTLKILKNSHPDLLDATLSGHQLSLRRLGKGSGTARITLQAENAAKSRVNTSFTVTVQ